MKNIYLDNSATSFPKAPNVAANMSRYIEELGCNANRGTYHTSFKVEDVVYETRELICKLFNFHTPENVIFTKNITESMNVIIKGLFKERDHVIVSSMEHNAIMRPLHAQGIDFSKVPCDTQGILNPEDLKKYITKETKAVIMTHASNVCGTIIDLQAVGRICKEHNLLFIIDSAQTAGFVDIDFIALNADIIGFTGHKGLLGPQGIGGFVISKECANRMDTLIEGGTGSLSDSEIQPSYMPDKFEAGTLNLPGIYGLNASLKYLFDKEIACIRNKEIDLLGYFLDQLKSINDIRIIGKTNLEDRCPIVSLDFITRDNAEVSYQLSSIYGILTRCGLHCSPSAHKSLGTFPHGTVRFSFGHFNTREEVEYTVQSITQIVSTN